jgi:peptide/nickel transport system permease protein
VLNHVGLAIAALAASLCIAFVIYLRAGEWELEHAKQLGFPPADVVVLDEAFGPGRSTAHLFGRYIVSTLEGGLGATIDGPTHRAELFGYMWRSVVWFVPTVLGASVVGSWMGHASVGRRRQRNGVVSTVLASLPFAFLPLAVSFALQEVAAGAWWSLWRHPVASSAIVVGTVMTGEAALASRRVIEDAARTSDLEMVTTWRYAFVRSVRCLPRSLGYAAAGVVAAEWIRGSGLGSLWVGTVTLPSTWMAGVFFIFALLAIVTWFFVEVAVIRRSPRPAAASTVETQRTSRSGLVPAAWVGVAALMLFGAITIAAPRIASGWDAIHPERSNEFNLPASPTWIQEPSSTAYGFLGTDPLGRDVVGILVWELRNTSMVGVVAAMTATAVGALLAAASRSSRRWVSTPSEVAGGYLLLLPSLAIVGAMLIFSNAERPAAWLVWLLGGIPLGLLMSAVPLRSIRRAGRGGHVRQALEGALQVFASAIGVWTMTAIIRIAPSAHPSLGSLASNVEILRFAWWMWLPEAVLLFVVILAARLVVLGLGTTVTPWLPPDN